MSIDWLAPCFVKLICREQSGTDSTYNVFYICHVYQNSMDFYYQDSVACNLYQECTWSNHALPNIMLRCMTVAHYNLLSITRQQHLLNIPLVILLDLRFLKQQELQKSECFCTANIDLLQCCQRHYLYLTVYMPIVASR